MRVLIDASGITRNKAGVGVYAKELIDRLAGAAGLELYLLVQDDDPDLDYGARSTVKMVKVPSRLMRSRPVRIAFEQTVLPLILLRHRIEVVHSLHYSFPLASFGAKRVVTIHDLTYVSMPELHLASKRWFFRFFIAKAAKAADGVIFISHSAAADFERCFGRPRGVAVVIHHGRSKGFEPLGEGGSAQAIRAKYGLPERAIVYIGTIEPRKNLTRLVEAFARASVEQPEVSLAIAGMKGWMYDGLFQRVKELGLEPKVLFLGFVPEEDKRALLCAAEVFAYVSLYEGFGLPVLEALACGVPTVASNTSSIPEIAGSAALLVDPLSVEEIAAGLKRLLAEPELRDRLREAGLQQAARFTWEWTASETVAMYRRVFDRSV